MATTAEILAKEAANTASIYLFREGMFWKAYQKSAYRVIQRGSNFKTIKKFVKAVSAEIVSLGFPDATLGRIFHDAEIEKLSDKLLVVADGETDEACYAEWFAAVPMNINLPTGYHDYTGGFPVGAKYLSPSSCDAMAGISDAMSGKGEISFAPTHDAMAKTSDRIVRKIKEFRIEESTPLDCMNFLVSLRKELYQDGYL